MQSEEYLKQPTDNYLNTEKYSEVQFQAGATSGRHVQGQTVSSLHLRDTTLDKKKFKRNELWFSFYIFLLRLQTSQRVERNKKGEKEEFFLHLAY